MKNLPMKLISAAVIAAASGATYASGFALQNQNGSGTGNAFAGAAAATDDASTVYYNPAAMGELAPGTHISLAATQIQRSIKFKDQGTAPINLGAGPYPLGTSGGEAGGGGLAPGAFVTHTLSPGLTVGFGVAGTFGNTTEYSDDFIGRFSGYYTSLKIINASPTVSYKVDEQWSLGLGANIANAEIEFRQMAPVSSSAQALLAHLEAKVVIKGDDQATGWNVGALFKPMPGVKLAATYRSPIKFKLEGTMETTAAGNTSSSDVLAELEVPPTWSLAGSYKVMPELELLADYTWTGWSSIKSLNVTAAANGAAITSLNYNFHDTAHYGVGANYQLNEALKLRFGVQFDEAPVKNNVDRTMTLPDSDRTWVSVGARYNLTKGQSVDLGYTHITFKSAETSRAVAPTGTPLQVVRGSFDTSADLYSVQYNHHF